MKAKRITVWVAEVYMSEYPSPNRRAYLATETDAHKYIGLPQNAGATSTKIFTMTGTYDGRSFCPDRQAFR